MNFLLQAIFGNLACSLWFCPPLCKFIHKLRGVRIRESGSLFISRGVVLDNRYPGLIDIGADVWLTQNVTVLTHSYSSHYQLQKFGLEELIAAVHIERGVFIGTGSIILPGVTLGEGCYIGAGSVVTGSIPPGVLAVGNPCKVIRKLTVSL